MNIVKIDYSSLVTVPLVLLNKEVSTKDLNLYVDRIRQIYNSHLTHVNFDLGKSSKMFFELTRFWWIDSMMNENGDTIYSFKDGVTYDIKQRLLNETKEEVLSVLKDEYALEVFRNKTKKLVN